VADKGMRLSWITIGYGAYLVVSASFMLQVNEWLSAAVGNELLIRSFWAFAISVLIALVAHILWARLGFFKLCAVILIFIVGYLIGMWPEYFEEKTHLLMYGLLGYMACKDLVGRDRTAAPINMAASAAFVALTSISDEVFQWILPYRVGDLRDVVLNVLGGILGIAMFLALKRRPR